VDAAYFAVVTLTTVGYGDLHPDRRGARPIAGGKDKHMIHFDIFVVFPPDFL